jgi:hypothetical protein
MKIIKADFSKTILFFILALNARSAIAHDGGGLGELILIIACFPILLGLFLRLAKQGMRWMWTCIFLFVYPLLVIRVLTIKTWSVGMLIATALPLMLMLALLIGSRMHGADKLANPTEFQAAEERDYSKLVSSVIRWLRWLVIPYLILIEVAGFIGLFLFNGNSVNINQTWLNYLLTAVLLAGIPVLTLLSKGKQKWLRMMQLIGVLLLTLMLILLLIGVATAFDFWMYPNHIGIVINTITRIVESVGNQFSHQVK